MFLSFVSLLAFTLRFEPAVAVAVAFGSLEMLSRGSLSEKSALAVIGTHQDAYSVAPDVRIKALELVEEGKLSERGLVAILGV